MKARHELDVRPTFGMQEGGSVVRAEGGAASGAEDATYVRAELLAEHAELELLIDTLREAVAAGDSKALPEPWRKFEEGLAQHFAVEEAELFPAFAVQARSEVERFLTAHSQIRKLAENVALRVELHIVRAEEVAQLLAALRTHRIAEEGAFYRWADGRARRAT
jgi:hypothetical protein